MKTTIAIGLTLAVARIWIGCNVAPEAFAWDQAYKDSAHLFIGGLAVAAWRDEHAWQWRLFSGLCILEVTVALWSRI